MTRPRLAPLQHYLAHRIEFLWYMGGATNMLMNIYGIEMLCEGLPRQCAYMLSCVEKATLSYKVIKFYSKNRKTTICFIQGNTLD